MTHFLFVVSAIAHAIAYALAAIYAYVVEHHADMCPIYMVIAAAALIHLVAAILQWRKSKPGSDPNDAGQSPLADARRTTYYDDRREPVYTEWEAAPAIPAAISRPPTAGAEPAAERPKAA